MRLTIPRLRRGFAAVMAVLAISACQSPNAMQTAGQLAASGPGRPIQADGSFVDSASSLSFPATLGDFRRTGITRSGVQATALQVAYQQQEAAGPVTATIRIYPAPWHNQVVPAQLSGPQFSGVCRPEFERIKKGVEAEYPGAQFLDERGVIDVSGNKFMGYTRLVYGLGKNSGQSKRILHVYATCLGERGWILRSDLTAPDGVDLQAAFEKLKREFIAQSAGPQGYGWDGAPTTI